MSREIDNALDFDLALEVAPFFRLKPHSAEVILHQIRNAVATWQQHANAVGIPRSEQEITAAAFQSHD